MARDCFFPHWRTIQRSHLRFRGFNAPQLSGIEAPWFTTEFFILRVHLLRLQSFSFSTSFNTMHFTISFAALMTLALSVVALPSPNVDTVRERQLYTIENQYLSSFFFQGMVTKRETSYGNPDLVVDQGDRWKLNFGFTDGHLNACPGSCKSFYPASPESRRSYLIP